MLAPKGVGNDKVKGQRLVAAKGPESGYQIQGFSSRATRTIHAAEPVYQVQPARPA